MGVSLAIECPVLRRGAVSWTDVVGVKGVRNAKE